MNAGGTWPERYPPLRLRVETRAMAEVWVEVLLERLPEGTLRAVHFKGSAVKPWDTPIDYVPTVSDVDIHVTLASDADEGHVDDMDAALAVNEAVLNSYLRRVVDPLHVPRPQFVIANRLDQDEGILPSPAVTVVTLFGEPYPDRALSNEEQVAQRARDRDQLLRHVEFVAALPLRAIDRPGDYLAPLLGELHWRVSPVAPRVLEVLGVPYADAWSWNRTRLVAELRARDLDALASAYESYYLAGWRRFLEWNTGDAPLEALRAGASVIRLGADIARDTAGS